MVQPPLDGRPGGRITEAAGRRGLDGLAQRCERPARPPVQRGGFAALRTSDRDRTFRPRHVRRRWMRVVQPGRLPPAVPGGGRSPVTPAQPGQVRLFQCPARRRRGRRLDLWDRQPAIGWGTGRGRDRRLRRRHQSDRSRRHGVRPPFRVWPPHSTASHSTRAPRPLNWRPARPGSTPGTTP